MILRVSFKAGLKRNLFLKTLIVGFPLAGVCGEPSEQPFIDAVRSQLSPQAEEKTDSKSYTERLKTSLDAGQKKEQEIEPYLEKQKAQLEFQKKTDKDQDDSEKGHQPFIDIEKAKIEPQPEGGAIQSYWEGRSELKARKVGEIHHAFGLRYGHSPTRTITAESGTQLRNFNDVYGSIYAPDISVFYEYQPFHSEWLGSLGFVGMIGMTYLYGKGQFSTQLTLPGGGNSPLLSGTRFQFFMVPATVGVNYRFNLLRLFRPYLFVGASEIGFLEMRTDQVAGNRGHSEGYILSAGVSILLDWISRSETWDLYGTFGIKHYYLSIDYTRTG